MKKAIVIGATSGIGRNLAKLLVENGYLVAITGRRTHLLDEIKAENANSYLTKTFDTTQTLSISSNLNDLVLEMGGLDLMIISSGTGDINSNLDFEIEKRTIDTNVSGFTSIVDWTFNFFQTQKSGQLVAISSIAGLRGNNQSPSYSASKAYQISYLEGIRIKAAKTNLPIYVTDIRPGFVNTEMAKGDKIFWLVPVDKASMQIYNAILKKQKVAYITKRWVILAYIYKLLPNFLIDRA